MKFANTSRTLSFLSHSFLVLLFGFLGIYFGCLVVPFFFASSVDQIVPVFEGAYLLYLELSVIGWSLAVLSGFGVWHAVKALQNPRDDEPVVKSLTILISEGWVLGLFFLLQGVLFFDLTGKNSAADNRVFVIIASLLIAIGLLIATNIPMVKLYDGKDQKPLIRGFVGAGLVVACATLVETLSTLIGLLTNEGMNIVTRSRFMWFLLIIIIMNAVAAILLSLSYFVVFKKDPKKVALLAGIAVVVIALGLIAYGVLSIVWFEKGVALNAISKNNTFFFDGESYGYGFAVMNFVVAAFVSVLGASLLYTGVSKKA